MAYTLKEIYDFWKEGCDKGIYTKSIILRYDEHLDNWINVLAYIGGESKNPYTYVGNIYQLGFVCGHRICTWDTTLPDIMAEILQNVYERVCEVTLEYVWALRSISNDYNVSYDDSMIKYILDRKDE